MATQVAINGFGRMGRLIVRALSHHPELHLVHVNELKGDVTTAAHLLQFDTVHGKFDGVSETNVSVIPPTHRQKIFRGMTSGLTSFSNAQER